MREQRTSEEPKPKKQRRLAQGARVRCPYCGAPQIVSDDDDPDRVIGRHMAKCVKQHLHPQYADAPPAPAVPERRPKSRQR